MQTELKSAPIYAPYRFWRATGLNASAAIEKARLDLAMNKQRYPQSVTGWNRPSKDGSRWIESLSGAGLRFVGYADELVRIDHKGWYTEDDGDNGEVLRGAVLQLPGTHGQARYLAAYEDPNNEGAYRVDMERGLFIAPKDRWQGYAENNDELRDAARAADSFAESQAEEERDYNRAWRAGSDYAALGEEIAQHRKNAMALAREIKAAGKSSFAPTICATLRAHIASHLRDIAKARKQRAALADSVSREQYPAFNEGASETVLS